MSPPSEASLSRPVDSGQREYSSEERRLLLETAHDAILSALESREVLPFTPSTHLAEPRGVFTTLYLIGRLRGCVGYPTALMPLYRAVTESAWAAAFEDPRFPPVALEEARTVKVCLSVLSPLMPILPEQIELGRHGLLISEGSGRGLLLPQVPVEHGWDRDTFLEQTCRKAGLPTDAWRNGANIKIEAFTAEVFSDDACGG
jgi:AmmeMemoRadiSam system protein A